MRPLSSIQPALTGCIDDKYDLSDVDTTVRVNVDNLTSLNIPSSLQIRTDFNFTPIDVTSFTGLINYDITDFNVKDVDVSNLPDVLSQEGTDLHLANPQIYFTIGRNPSNTYCMSPMMPSQLYPGYSGAEHIAYTSLSDILSGNGLPKRLSVAFNDTKVPRQHVANFRLDHDYGSVDGTFTIVAPLEFAGGSRLIYYTDTLDGLRFTATATPGEESAPLAPDMHIAITDIRPVVSGYYQKKL